MGPRVILAHWLIRLGKFISSLAVAVMRPDDLVEFGPEPRRDGPFRKDSAERREDAPFGCWGWARSHPSGSSGL